MRKSLMFGIMLVMISGIWSDAKSQVVINEIQMQPAGSSTGTNPQNLADCAPNSGAEFIELYNTNQCSSVDISCYILANNIAGTSAAAHGAFRFPAGTIIPPLGFVSIGGVNSGATFILNNYCGTQNLAINPAGRWYLPNGDGYMMLYDATGAAVDAVYWTTGSTAADQAKWGTDSDINTNPTRIPAGTGGCTNIVSLPGPANLPIASAEWMGQAAGNGLSCSRQTDGSTTWVNNVAGTVNACNGACVVANTFFVPASVTQPTCSSNNGVITITPSPIGAYTYTWSPNVSSTNTASSLSGGTYSVTISSGGCSKDTTITLTSASGITNVASTVTNPTCGQNNGSVSIGAVTGGSGPYQYNFNNLGFSGTTQYNNLGSGNYNLVVQDASLCTYSTSISVNASAGPNNLATTNTNTSCGLNNGSIVIGNVSGGTSPYQYNFNNQGFSGTTSYTGLSAGTYSIIVQDASSCTYSTTVTLSASSAPTAISSTTSDPSCGQNNGSININSTTGGTGPYQYNFNNQGFAAITIFSNLSAGTYTIIVQDATLCTYTTTVNLSSSSGPNNIATTITQTTCGQNNGGLNLGAVTGGLAPYQYNFNNLGLSGNTSFSNLAAGNYSLIVNDANNCSYSTTITINPSSAPTNIQTTLTNPGCGLSDGSIIITGVTGGSAPYQYNFNNQGLASNTSYTGLSAGTYSITVQDASSCTFSTTATIGSSTSPTNIVLNVTNTSCGLNNGSVILGTVTGGTAPYQYNFNNLGFSATTSYSNLSAGSYSIIVKDAIGCTLSTTTNIGSSNAPTSLATNIINASCGLSNGSVSIGNVSGGTAPYQYNFNNMGFSQVSNYTGLPAGTYTISIKDAASCTYSTSVIVTPGATGPTGFQYVVNNPVCGTNSGSIAITNVNGGTPQYLYGILNNTPSTSPNFNNLSAGLYTVSVQDASGCSYSENILIEKELYEETVYIPNCFTPNDDEINNEWFIDGNCIKELKCYIYNRWGQLITVLDNNTEKWDGKFKNEMVADGVYVYHGKVTFYSGDTKNFSGHITLIR